MNSFNKQLNNLRTEIDDLDQQIVNLLALRMKTVQKIGTLKREEKIPALDENRWQQVLENRKELAEKLQLNTKLIENIYNLIHQESLKIEN
jgi:chorismate mutase